MKEKTWYSSYFSQCRFVILISIKETYVRNSEYYQKYRKALSNNKGAITPINRPITFDYRIILGLLNTKPYNVTDLFYN